METKERTVLECYPCKGIYFKVVAKRHEYDTVDVLALKCIECGHEIPFDKDVWLYGGVSDRGAIPMSNKT